MIATHTLENRLAVREQPQRSHVMLQLWEQLAFIDSAGVDVRVYPLTA